MVDNCLIIAPDDFASDIEGEYTAEAWAAAEALGLVCLPPAGRRGDDVERIYDGGSNGYYWSSSHYENSEEGAYSLDFSSSSVNPANSPYRYRGSSLRLVK